MSRKLMQIATIIAVSGAAGATYCDAQLRYVSRTREMLRCPEGWYERGNRAMLIMRAPVSSGVWRLVPPYVNGMYEE
jgi:hypothetical protein